MDHRSRLHFQQCCCEANAASPESGVLSSQQSKALDRFELLWYLHQCGQRKRSSLHVTRCSRGSRLYLYIDHGT